MAASWQALHCCILLWCTACVAQQSPPSLWDSLGSNSPLTVQSIGSDPPKATPPHAGSTDVTDVAAITAFRNALFKEPVQAQQLGWINGTDPCDRNSSGDVEGNWSGLLCRGWRIVAIDLPSNESSVPGLLLQGTLPAQLAQLTALEMLLLPGHQIYGTLPPELGMLASLETLDLSFNRLTGVLPSEWSQMASITVMDLSNNYLTGEVPPSWSNLSHLNDLDLADNSGLCIVTQLPQHTHIITGSPLSICATAAENGTAVISAPPPALAPTSPPVQYNVLQMSTGINIAVSVVIGTFLLAGITAGAIRVRRQTRAHRVWLEQRQAAQEAAEREEEEAAHRTGAAEKPYVVLAPDGAQLFLAKRLDPLPEAAPKGQEDVDLGSGDASEHGPSPPPSAPTTAAPASALSEEAGPASANGAEQPAGDAPGAEADADAQPGSSGAGEEGGPPRGLLPRLVAAMPLPADNFFLSRMRNGHSQQVRQQQEIEEQLAIARQERIALHREVVLRRRRRRVLPMYVVTLDQTEAPGEEPTLEFGVGDDAQTEAPATAEAGDYVSISMPPAAAAPGPGRRRWWQHRGRSGESAAAAPSGPQPSGPSRPESAAGSVSGRLASEGPGRRNAAAVSERIQALAVAEPSVDANLPPPPSPGLLGRIPVIGRALGLTDDVTDEARRTAREARASQV